MMSINSIKILSVIFLSVMSFLYGQNKSADSFQYSIIRHHIFNNELEIADSLIQINLKENSKNPQLNLLKAFILLKYNGLENRIRANEIIEKYARKAKDDPFTHFLLGYLYKSAGKRAFTDKYFKKAIKMDPAFIEAIVELGDLYYQEMLAYMNRFTDGEIPLSFRKFATQDFLNAEKYLKQALRIEPYNERALYTLGLLYYEEKQLDDMISLYKKALELDSNDVDFNLFIGLAYQNQKNFYLSDRHFKRAINNMNEEESDYFINPELFLEQTIIDTEPEKFWQERDPLFLTDENERLSEHISRMAYTNLRFNVSKIGIKGWETDRGKAFIRYGQPLFIISLGKDIGLAPLENWFYPGFKLSFEDNYWNGNYRFATPELNRSGISAFKSRADADYIIVANDIFTELPEIYNFSLAGGRFGSIYKFAAFKGANNQTEMMITFELPIDGFVKLDSLNFETGIFIKEKESETKQGFIEKLIPDYKIHGYQLFGNKLLDNIIFKAKANRYSYSFEIIENQNNAMFVSRDSLVIPSFTGNNLNISDVILANRIESERRNLKFMRNELFILPNVRQVFYPDKMMYIYFEVYNLSENEDGETIYTVENSLIGNSKKGFLSKLFSKKQDRITIVNEYRGSENNDFVVQALDLRNLKNGQYQLEIKVTDKLGKETISKNEILQIINDN